jgi:hypothetical protein
LEKCSSGPGESAGKLVVGVGDVVFMVVVKTGGIMQLRDGDELAIGIGIVAVEFGLIRAEEGEEEAAVAGDVEFDKGVILISRFAIDSAEDAGVVVVVADALAGAVGVAVVVTVEFNAANMGK